MLGKAHLFCSSLSNFAPDETKLPCLILLQGYVVVSNPASPNARKSLIRFQHCQNSLPLAGIYGEVAGLLGKVQLLC